MFISSRLLWAVSSAMTLMSFCTTAHAEAWRSSGDPSIFYNDYKRNFNELQKYPEARLPDDKMPWSEVYWRSQFGGIAARWFGTEEKIPKQLDKDLLSHDKDTRNKAAMAQAPYYRGYFDRGELLTHEKLKKASIEELKQLSASEKFDIYLGHYTRNNFYPWTQKVLANNSIFADEWFGICQGWAGAAISYDEPAAVLVPSLGDPSIMVPFGSSDVKGLMSQMFADEGFGNNTSQLSKRCGGRKEKDCIDVNPGSLHIVMTNQIAIKQKAFAADADNGVEVWNQPYTGYKVEILEPYAKMYRDAAPGTKRVVKVRTILEYASDDVYSQWEPMLTRKEGVANNPMNFNYVGNEWYADESFSGQAFAYQVMEYYLDLDASDEIIGGQWIRSYVPDNRYVEHPKFRWVNFDYRNPAKTTMMFPDFLWIARGTFKPQGDWALLMNNVYKPSHGKK